MNSPILRISPSDLESLLSTLEVNFVALSECLVSPGYRLELAGDVGAPGIHYNLAGAGKIIMRSEPPIELVPHTLIVVPPNCPFQIEALAKHDPTTHLISVDGRMAISSGGEIRRFVAGSEPEIILICGYFRATYGTSVDLFGSLSAPIVEQFAANDQLDQKLNAALRELVAQEIGAGAMSAALLKQVIVALLRRSLRSFELWVERFAMLSDPQIARAFSVMAAHPGAPHTTRSLAEAAALSRSAFMARFTALIGRSPMAVLRDLRMRQAAQLLRTSGLGIERIAGNVGYVSRSSFVRAFRQAFRTDPSAFRGATTPRSAQQSPPI